MFFGSTHPVSTIRSEITKAYNGKKPLSIDTQGLFFRTLPDGGKIAICSMSNYNVVCSDSSVRT